MIFLSSVTSIFKSYMGGDKSFSSAVDRLICMSAEIVRKPFLCIHYNGTTIVLSKLRSYDI